MNSTFRCINFLQNQLWHSGKFLNASRFASFESSISLKNLYPSSSLSIKTPSISKIPKKEDQGFSGFVPVDQLIITASRSSGPGGQHVNTTSSKVDVRFRVDDAKWLENDLKAKIKVMWKNRITSDGYLFVTSDRTRSQQLNIANCLEKIRELVWKAEGPVKEELSEEDKALQLKKIEIANRERLSRKRRRSQDKQNRRADDGFID